MHESKTVYFLGAGASAASDFPLPVMKGFFREEDFQEKDGKYQNLKEFFANYCPTIPLKKINLEEIITHLELTLEGFKWGLTDSSLNDTKQEIYNYIRYRLDDPVRDKICSNYSKLLKYLNPNNDSIISLNYDLVVDNVLSDYKGHVKKSNLNDLDLDETLLNGITRNDDRNVNFAYFTTRNKEIFIKQLNSQRNQNLINNTQESSILDLWEKSQEEKLPSEFRHFMDRSYDLFLNRVTNSGFSPIEVGHIGRGVYIKIHGSINWIYCPSSDCINNSYFWPYNYNLGESCKSCGTNIETVIVPPTMKKSFEKFPKLGFIWHVAFDKLKEADKIIVIGLSFPDSDYYLKWLIKQAVLERSKNGKPSLKLIIVNNKETDRDKNAEIFGISPEKEFETLDDKFYEYLSNVNK